MYDLRKMSRQDSWLMNKSVKSNQNWIRISFFLILKIEIAF